MKTWSKLSIKEKRSWNKFVKKHQSFLGVFKELMEEGCFWCKKRYKAKSWNEMNFHVHSTHGLPLYYIIKYATMKNET